MSCDNCARVAAAVAERKKQLREYRKTHAGHAFCEALFREIENTVNDCKKVT